MYSSIHIGYDTRDFDVQVLRKLETDLDPSVLSQVKWQIVGQAKPWHTTALKVLQGIRYVQDKKDAKTALSCFRFFLDNIPNWDNTRLQVETITGYMDKLAAQFGQISGISAAEIRPELQHYSKTDGPARQEFKYTIGNRRSGLNPSIYLNGAKVDNGLNMSLQQWKDLLGSMLQ